MRELTFEIPFMENLSDNSSGAALSLVDSAYFLKMRSDGFAIIGRVQSKDLPAFQSSISAAQSRNFRTRVLSKERSGAQILLLDGKWEALLSPTQMANALRMLKEMEREPVFDIGHPSINGNKLHISLMLNEESSQRLMDGMQRMRVPFRILNYARPEGRGVRTCPA